ncbi:response regulator transcription factor [Tissierella praeacuta]|uniref:response regulator transcription factor n=1 Tax=Tissierella praeacuta TaxID=43131 RepID=UPI001C1067AF|nr:response regulator transcription factor [Tissierella praeacuta]MBU5255304.1 response regulator transcription factor [Tissierella praeacuta]
MKILIVEDEKELLETIADGLRLSGYAVDTAMDGVTAEEMCYVETYDLIILDINLPKMDGFSVLKKVREYSKVVNIIMLTARSEVADRVKGLDLGANDYLIKPFHFEELEARIRSLLRRKAVQENTLLHCGELSFDTISRIAYVNGDEIKLTGKETGILEYLLLNWGRYVTQEELFQHVWDSEADSFSNAVRVHMSALRKKLKESTGRNMITNVIGKGYLISEE